MKSQKKNLFIAIYSTAFLLTIGLISFIEYQATLPENLKLEEDTQKAVVAKLPTPTIDFSRYAVKEFTVEARDYAFSPDTVMVEKGDAVRITFIVEEGYHNFVIPEYDVATLPLATDKKEVLEFIATQSGEFEFKSHVPKRQKPSMEGSLIVQ